MNVDEATWIQVCTALFSNPNAHEQDLAACRGLLEASPPFMSMEGVLLCSVAMACLTYLVTHWPGTTRARSVPRGSGVQITSEIQEQHDHEDDGKR